MKPFLKDALGWGFALWLIGCALGVALFLVVPPSLIGWLITPLKKRVLLVIVNDACWSCPRILSNNSDAYLETSLN